MISFRLQLTLILAVAFVIFLGGTSSLAFNYFYWIVSKMGGTYKFSSIIYFFNIHVHHSVACQVPLWLLLAFVRWKVWSHKRRSSNRVGTRSVVRSFCLSCDSIALSNNTWLQCTTIACRRKIYRKIQYVYIAQRSLWIVRVSYKFFLICDNANVTVYKPYLICF